MTQLRALEIEEKGLRAAWPPPVGWSFRLIREAGAVQGVEGKHFVHARAHTCTCAHPRTHAHTHADMLSPSPHGIGAPLSCTQSSGKMVVLTLLGSVWTLARRWDLGDSQSWLQLTVDKLLNPSWLHCLYP